MKSDNEKDDDEDEGGRRGLGRSAEGGQQQGLETRRAPAIRKFFSFFLLYLTLQTNHLQVIYYAIAKYGT
jgi:hypothetical protein